MTISDNMQGKKMTANMKLRGSDAEHILNMTGEAKNKLVADVIQIILLDIPCTPKQREQAKQVTLQHINQLIARLNKLREPEDTFRRIPISQNGAIQNEWNRKVGDCLDPVINLAKEFAKQPSPEQPVEAPQASKVVAIPLGGFMANFLRNFSGADLYYFSDMPIEDQQRKVADITVTLVETGGMSAQTAAGFRQTLQEEFKINSYAISADLLAGSIYPDNKKLDGQGEKIANAIFNERYKQKLISFTSRLLSNYRQQKIQGSTGSEFPGPQNG